MAFLMFAKTLAKNTRLRPGIWCFTSSLVFNVKLWAGEAGWCGDGGGGGASKEDSK